MRIPGLEGIALRELATRTVRDFLDDEMTTYAAALAFRLLLALFPFTIFLLGTFGLPEAVVRMFEQAQTVLPPAAARSIDQVIDEVQRQPGRGLSVFGGVIAVWAAAAGVRSLMHALNAAYDVAESRPGWQRFLLSFVYTIGFTALLIAAAVLMLIGPRVARWLAGHFGLADIVVALWTWLRWPVAALLLLLTIDIIYYVAPNIRQPFRLVTPGGVLALAAWIAASLGFSYFVSTIGRYGATYGSLGGAVVLLLYFFISGVALLLGAEVNATIQHLGEAAATPEADAQAETE